MSTKMVRKNGQDKKNSKKKDSFESYLKEKCFKTTFNGLDISSFSSCKKALV